MKSLIQKYNTQGPRYTSYPPVPYWNRIPTQEDWFLEINKTLKKSNSIDIYIHIPYCEKLCYYCGCNRVISKDKNKANEYVNALIAEWSIYKSNIDHDFEINSIHLGGGTPTFLPADQLTRLLSIFSPYLSKSFTGSIEIDPRTVTKDHFAVISAFNFKRLSLGIQDFDLNVQKQINRIQPYEMIEALVEKIRVYGDFHLNFDLIYGLPAQTIDSINDTLSKVIKLKPESIAFYSYAHLPNSIPNQRLIKSELLPEGEQKLDMLLKAQEVLGQSNYIAIGMDHFALETSFLSNKNLTRNFMGYTDKKSALLIGLGVSSIGQSETMFIQNSKTVSEYLDGIEKCQLPITNGHILDSNEIQLSNEIQDIFCIGELKLDSERLEDETMKKELAQLEADGLISMETDNKLKVTHLGKKFLRNIAMAIDPLMRKNSFQRFSKTV